MDTHLYYHFFCVSNKLRNNTARHYWTIIIKFYYTHFLSIDAEHCQHALYKKVNTYWFLTSHISNCSPGFFPLNIVKMFWNSWSGMRCLDNLYKWRKPWKNHLHFILLGCQPCHLSWIGHVKNVIVYTMQSLVLIGNICFSSCNAAQNRDKKDSGNLHRKELRICKYP